MNPYDGNTWPVPGRAAKMPRKVRRNTGAAAAVRRVGIVTAGTAGAVKPSAETVATRRLQSSARSLLADGAPNIKRLAKSGLVHVH